MAHKTRLGRRASRSVVVIGTSTVVYYATPAPGSHGVVFNVIWSTVATGVAAFVAGRQVVARVREYQTSGDRPIVGLETLANVLFIVALLFATGYFALARWTKQMSGIADHTDALYFSMTVLSTVGFGDIHATGSIGRGVVTAQMLFDLVFVASAVGLVVGSIVSRTDRQMDRP
jgi:hypothetical protein